MQSHSHVRAFAELHTQAGMESLGESFLCLEQRDKNFVSLLVGQPPESLVSPLKSPMRRGEPHEQKQYEGAPILVSCTTNYMYAEDMFQRLVSDGLWCVAACWCRD